MVDWRRQVVVGILFGTSVLAALARVVIRLRMQRRLYLDDAFLFFACVCLSAATGLLYRSVGVMYSDEELVIDPSSAFSALLLIPQLLWFEKILDSYLALLWAAIFAVKLSFLVLFKSLIRRLKGITVYWSFAVTITTIVGCLCVTDSFMSCPHFNISARKIILLHPLFVCTWLIVYCSTMCFWF